MGDKVDRLKGQVEEKAGEATDDPGLAQRGRDKQAKADVKKSAEKAKEAIKKQV